MQPVTDSEVCNNESGYKTVGENEEDLCVTKSTICEEQLYFASFKINAYLKVYKVHL